MRWSENRLLMLDQRALPLNEVWLELNHPAAVAEAIRDMAVRGAPAIGVAAAYGMALAALRGEDWDASRKLLAESRPTAVNLFWALERMDQLADRSAGTALAEAKAIEAEDRAMNERIGAHGAGLVPKGARALTICNTGSLATAGHGTALGILRTAFAEGKLQKVYACETRPRQQGLRLTAYELKQDGIPFAAIADSVAGPLMAKGEIDFVVAGADRIARNGDTANKVGTYTLAVLAARHGIPFYIAAPSSTFDASISDGASIPIEERAAEELTEIEGRRIAPLDIPVYNPAFDVTPAELIAAIVSEKGVHRAPYDFSSQ